MRYVTSLREIDDLIELNLLRSEASVYDSHLADVDVRQDSDIEPLGHCIGMFGKHHLVMDPETASWVLMDDEEKDIYCSLQCGKFSQQTERFRVLTDDCQIGFLKALFRRGLVGLDGKYAIRRDMYCDGLPYRDALLVELLITERCNMACLYCQAHASAQKQDMMEDVAKATVERAFELDHSTIIFELSGGEPLINFDLICKSVDLIEKRASATGKSVVIALVTNGALLRPQVAEFIVNHYIKLGISLDGPEEIHQLSRPLTDGSSSRHLQQSILDVIQSHNVPFGVLVTVNRYNCHYAKEIVHFLANLNPHSVKINPVARVGRAANQEAINVSSGDYLDFMKVVFDNMVDHNTIIPEFNIGEMVNRLITRFRDYRCMRAHCNAGVTYMVIDPIGRIFPCAQMTGYPHTELGNVLRLEKRLDELAFDNSFIQRFNSRRISQVAVCCSCEWRRFCEGGCIVEVLEDSQVEFNSVRSPNCHFYRGMYGHIMETLSLKPDGLDAYLKSEKFGYGPGLVVDENPIYPSCRIQV